jgi:hypothetical protein
MWTSAASIEQKYGICVSLQTPKHFMQWNHFKFKYMTNGDGNIEITIKDPNGAVVASVTGLQNDGMWVDFSFNSNDINSTNFLPGTGFKIIITTGASNNGAAYISDILIGHKEVVAQKTTLKTSEQDYDIVYGEAFDTITTSQDVEAGESVKIFYYKK